MKTIISLAILSGSLLASVINPTPTILTSCTVGGATVDCGSSAQPLIYGSERVGADTSFSLSGFGTSDGISIDAFAQAVAGGGSIGSSSLATILFDFFASTDGPERQGFATFRIGSDQEHGANGGASASSFITGLGSCQFALCSSQGTLVPFTLGVPFEIGLFARGSGGSGPHPFDGGGGDSWIRLQLFEQSGEPVAIFDPPAVVPEPASYLLVLLGIIGLTSLEKASPAASRRS